MRKLVTIFSAALLLASCNQKALEISVSNSAPFSREHQTVEISWDSIKSRINLTQGEQIVILDNSGNQLPYQLITEGSENPTKLIFQTSLDSAQTKSFKLQVGRPEIFTPKTFARFVPERKDDFAWENDRVAFRAYGPALKPIDGPSNGFDAWTKRGDSLIIDKWYYRQEVEGKDYHNDYGDGCDYYKVGRTLGAGAAAPFVDGSLILGENYASYKILDNGPLRSTFELTYNKLFVQGDSVVEVRRVSIDAGSQLAKMEVHYQGAKPMDVAAGLAKRPQGDSVYVDNNHFFVAQQDVPTQEWGTTYLGLVSPTFFKQAGVMEGHLLATTPVDAGATATYYFGFGWSRWGFNSFQEWVDYLSKYSQELRSPVTVSIK